MTVLRCPSCGFSADTSDPSEPDFMVIENGEARPFEEHEPVVAPDVVAEPVPEHVEVPNGAVVGAYSADETKLVPSWTSGTSTVDEPNVEVPPA